MSRLFMVISIFAACIPQEDSVSILESEVKLQPDAGITPACWQWKSFQCGPKLFTVCVPYDGCSETFRCRGRNYGYCGPGAIAQ